MQRILRKAKWLACFLLKVEEMFVWMKWVVDVKETARPRLMSESDHLKLLYDIWSACKALSPFCQAAQDTSKVRE